MNGIVMCVIFNVTVALLFVLTPNSFSKILSKEIQKAGVQTDQAGVTGFWNLFWTRLYRDFFINLGIKSGKELEIMAPVLARIKDVSLAEGMKAPYSIYRIIGQIPPFRNLPNKLAVLEYYKNVK